MAPSGMGTVLLSGPGRGVTVFLNSPQSGYGSTLVTALFLLPQFANNFTNNLYECLHTYFQKSLPTI